jgi:hypothetical protein
VVVFDGAVGYAAAVTLGQLTTPGGALLVPSGCYIVPLDTVAVRRRLPALLVAAAALVCRHGSDLLGDGLGVAVQQDRPASATTP